MKRNLIYHTQIPAHNSVRTKSADGEFTTQLESIARDGMTLSCDRKTLDQLFPNTASIAPRQPKKLDVDFVLPGSGHAIKSTCEVFCMRRLSRDVFQLEMRFENLSEKDFEMIDRYIDAGLSQNHQAANQAA